jgi:hypothetical protein
MSKTLILLVGRFRACVEKGDKYKSVQMWQIRSI